MIYVEFAVGSDSVWTIGTTCRSEEAANVLGKACLREGIGFRGTNFNNESVYGLLPSTEVRAVYFHEALPNYTPTIHGHVWSLDSLQRSLNETTSLPEPEEGNEA